MNRRRRVEATPMIQIASMLDMFTILLVFLLNFLDPSTPSEQEVALPRSTTVAEVPQGVVVTVTTRDVRVAGRVLATFDPGPVLPANVDLAEELAAFVPTSTDGKEMPLVVQVDRALPYGVVSDVLRAAGTAGFSQFRFVVLHGSG